MLASIFYLPTCKLQAWFPTSEDALAAAFEPSVSVMLELVEEDLRVASQTHLWVWHFYVHSGWGTFMT